MKKLNKIAFFLSYLIILLFLFIIVDVFIFNRLLGLGNKQYLPGEYYKVDYPFVGFVSREIAETEPYSMYYDGKDLYDNNENKIKIAFFGGSTAAYSSPGLDDKKYGLTIPQYLEKTLKNRLNKDVIVVNYACGGANHRQHMHMLPEFLPTFKPDIVIFYGGNNETIQATTDDPRFSYPFNYYYKSEIPLWEKFIAEYSAIGSVLYDKFSYKNIDKVRNRINYGSPEYYDKMVSNYIDTLALSKKITNTFDSKIFGQTVFIAIFQPMNVDIFLEENIIDKIREQLTSIEYAYDFYEKYDKFPDKIWADNCHVADEANQYMADEISDLLLEKYLKKYKK